MRGKVRREGVEEKGKIEMWKAGEERWGERRTKLGWETRGGMKGKDV